jgi:type I restriction-modification system DNA methylase subunit
MMTTLSIDKSKLDNLAGDIWKSAERLRGKFKPYEYQGVILPIIVIRRLECVLIAWREQKQVEVRTKRPKLTEKDLAKLVKGLETITAPFSNKTDLTFARFTRRTTRSSRRTSALTSTVSRRTSTRSSSTSTTGPPSRRW